MPRGSKDPSSDDPIALLLLPGPLESFILHDQAADLLAAPGVVAVEPGRMPAGALGRMPAGLGAGVGISQARRMDLPGVPAAVVIFHPLQYPLAVGVLTRFPDCELWYWRWDRFEKAYDADEKLRARLVEFHTAAAERAALTIVVSDELERLEREAERASVKVPLAADSFPAPAPADSVVAVSLGHLGHRTDWKLLREVGSAMGERLTLLLIGERHDDEMPGNDDFAWCCTASNFIWLGRLSDAAAAQMIRLADVGIVPFERSDFNDSALPYRILKYARLGRKTICSDLPGVRTWAQAVKIAPDADAWVRALESCAGTPRAGDAALRDWALGQTARKVDGPLFDRLEALGVATGRLGSERKR